MSNNVPPWCRWVQGHGRHLIVAPHGGRCLDAPRRATRRVNDLHTADLADELADGLGASLIANPMLDRNQLDLNRLSQVRHGAVWFLELLEQVLNAILERHERAEVLFLHGWNVIQPKCDIGIGRCLPDVTAAAAHAGELTVSAPYATARLAALVAACHEAGIGAPLGTRYPARHPNNLIQLFRRDGRAGAPPRLAAWVGAGRIDAVQLELGVPLRWPNDLRRRFTEIAQRVFSAPPTPAARDVAPCRRATPAGLAPPAALACYDAAAQLGISARVDALPGGRGVSGRLLLFIGERDVALFTGEDAGKQLSGGGPHFAPLADGFRLRFAGQLLRSDDGRRYVDLETAFAASQLITAELDLTFARTAPHYGRVRGHVTIDGAAHDIAALGFARPAALAGGGRAAWQAQVTLQAAFAEREALRVEHHVPGRSEVLPLSGDARPIASLHMRFAADPYAPAIICVDAGGETLIAEPRTHMAVERPLDGQRIARVTFGAAAFRLGERRGVGFYEYARALPVDR